MLKILKSKNGEGYIDVAVLVLCAMLVIALAVNVFPVYIQKQQIDTFAAELIREAEISGQVGSETERREQYLREKTGLSPTVAWSKTGRIQLNEEVTVTVTYPEGDSQLAWVKWKTPDTEQTLTIHVTVSGPGSTAKTTLNVKIVDLDKNSPPNPVADDRNDSYRIAAVPNRAIKSTANWSVWRPWWQEYWVWHGDDEDGYWCDHGWWEFDLDRYSASLTAAMSIKCDNRNPTASGRTMKSGYGINQTVIGSVSSNQSSAVTQPQNAVSYFPEFGYETYWRLLERMGSGRFEFQRNPYSTYKNRTHFSPIWMPDGAYTVNTWLIDGWTPDGMLSANLTDSLTIRGNLWSDWHVAPLNP